MFWFTVHFLIFIIYFFENYPAEFDIKGLIEAKGCGKPPVKAATPQSLWETFQIVKTILFLFIRETTKVLIETQFSIS